jgi:hypothetical protein
VNPKDRGHALQARDILNVIRQAVRNSAADRPGIARINRRAIDQCAIALKTLERLTSGDTPHAKQLRGELARALAVQHERAALEQEQKYRCSLDDEKRREFDVEKTRALSRSIDARFAYQVTRRGETRVDRALSDFAALSVAFADLRIAHGLDSRGRPIRHAQHHGLLRVRLENHG